MHVYLYFASATAIFSSLIHLIGMCKFIGVKDDQYDDENEEAKRDANKKYLIFSIIIVLPNLAFFIYGLTVLINAMSPPPSHELSGKGGITEDDYCYRGLWITLHMDLICTAALISMSLIIFAIVSYQIKQKKTTAWHTSTLPRRKRQESSWNGNPHYSQPKQSKPSSRSKPKPNPHSEPLIVSSKKKQYDRPNTIRGFDRHQQQRNSAKWHTPRRQDMQRPNYDPYGAIDV